MRGQYSSTRAQLGLAYLWTRQNCPSSANHGVHTSTQAVCQGNAKRHAWSSVLRRQPLCPMPADLYEPLWHPGMPIPPLISHCICHSHLLPPDLDQVGMLPQSCCNPYLMTLWRIWGVAFRTMMGILPLVVSYVRRQRRKGGGSLQGPL